MCEANDSRHLDIKKEGEYRWMPLLDNPAAYIQGQRMVIVCEFKAKQTKSSHY